MKSILVSIIMPVYNGEKYLREAIDSILEQTHKNFEFIIINDGSTDKSHEIITSYSDPRIIYIKQKNKGLDGTLNHTFTIVRGKYIARMDCDDLSFPTRLEKQVHFLESHPSYGMVGTQYINMDHARQLYEIGAQLMDSEDIKLAIQSMNVFCHGSVMFRAEFLKTNQITYNHTFYPYEDYELWTRIVKLTDTANLPEVLYAYMNNPTGMFLTMHKEMIEGPVLLGKKLQKSMYLPQLTFRLLLNFVTKSRKYRVKSITVHNQKFSSNFMLAYQTYLYKLGFVYLRRKHVSGVLLLTISFILHPGNWIKELLSKF